MASANINGMIGERCNVFIVDIIDIGNEYYNSLKIPNQAKEETAIDGVIVGCSTDSQNKINIIVKVTQLGKTENYLAEVPILKVYLKDEDV